MKDLMISREEAAALIVAASKGRFGTPLTEDEIRTALGLPPRQLQLIAGVVERTKERAETVARIFDYWRHVMKRPAARLTPDRKRKVASRLEEGYSETDIKAAILGCSKSEFHMGKNDRGMEYNTLELICRNGEKLERFMVIVGAKPPKIERRPTVKELRLMAAEGR